MITKTIDMLGLTGKDKVTGAVGVVECVSFDLYGCVQVGLRAQVDDKGATPESRWYDVSRITLQDAPRVMPVPAFQVMARTPEEYPHGAADKPARY